MELSLRQEFERAIELRDEIYALQRLQERQQVEKSRKYDQDVLSYQVDGSSVFLMLFKVYRGTLEGKEDYVFAQSDNFLEEFLVQYYSEREPPEELIVEEPLEQSLEDFLSHVKGKKVRVTIPKQGEKKELLELAKKNVEIGFFGDRKKLAGPAGSFASSQGLPRSSSASTSLIWPAPFLSALWCSFGGAGRIRATTAASKSRACREWTISPPLPR